MIDRLKMLQSSDASTQNLISLVDVATEGEFSQCHIDADGS